MRTEGQVSAPCDRCGREARLMGITKNGVLVYDDLCESCSVLEIELEMRVLNDKEEK